MAAMVDRGGGSKTRGVRYEVSGPYVLGVGLLAELLQLVIYRVMLRSALV